MRLKTTRVGKSLFEQRCDNASETELRGQFVRSLRCRNLSFHKMNSRTDATCAARARQVPAAAANRFFAKRRSNHVRRTRSRCRRWRSLTSQLMGSKRSSLTRARRWLQLFNGSNQIVGVLWGAAHYVSNKSHTISVLWSGLGGGRGIRSQRSGSHQRLKPISNR